MPSGSERPIPLVRARARASRASWRAHSRRSLGRTAHSATGSSSRRVPSSSTANASWSSRSGPGSAASAERSLCSCISRSISSTAPGLAQIWVRSAWSSPDPGPPSLPRAALAMESAWESALAAAARPRLGKRASFTTSLAMRRPGLTSTIWHSRLADGRRQGPALLCPRVTENGPSKFARSAGTPIPWVSPAGAGTSALSHPTTGPGQKKGPASFVGALPRCAPAG